MKTALYILIGIMAGALLTSLIWVAASPPRGEAIKLIPPPTQIPITVHVTGAVTKPGLYFLPQDSRVNDATRLMSLSYCRALPLEVLDFLLILTLLLNLNWKTCQGLVLLWHKKLSTIEPSMVFLQQSMP
jgi:hypothetical protein